MRPRARRALHRKSCGSRPSIRTSGPIAQASQPRKPRVRHSGLDCGHRCARRREAVERCGFDGAKPVLYGRFRGRREPLGRSRPVCAFDVGVDGNVSLSLRRKAYSSERRGPFRQVPSACSIALYAVAASEPASRHEGRSPCGGYDAMSSGASPPRDERTLAVRLHAIRVCLVVLAKPNASDASRGRSNRHRCRGGQTATPSLRRRDRQQLERRDAKSRRRLRAAAPQVARQQR